MSRQVTQHSQAGFTIIEAIIVLAIGGAILSLALLAIPALARSSRNNQRHQDVSQVLQATGNYELNNSATFPPANLTFLSSVPISYYDKTSTSSIVMVPDPRSGGVPGFNNPNTNVDVLIVAGYSKCKSDGSADYTGADYTDIVALYAIESATGTSAKCEQL